MKKSKYYNYLLLGILSIFSFFINFYYAKFGVNPMDSFVLYNAGFKVLNGLVPFKDYWVVTGPLMDYLNAFFFLIGGVNWNSYIFHSSFVNTLSSVAFYLFFKRLGLRTSFCFIYSLIFSILMYPSAGSPFVDHHATILVVITFFCFVIGAMNKNNLFLFLIPFFITLGFLIKQTPTVYGAFSIILLTVIFLIKNQEQIKRFFFSYFFGTIFACFFLFLFFLFTNIPVNNFIIQYINFASTVGTFRMETWSFSFLGFLHQYKFIIIPTVYLSYLSYKQFNKEKNFLLSLSIILLTIILLFHQILTMNENYIFFLIALVTSAIHLSTQSYKNEKKKILYFIIILSLFSSIKYHDRFNEKRKFHGLEFVNLTNAIDAKNIDESLQGLKWITRDYKNNPTKEIEGIKESIKIIKNKDENVTIITPYLFISSIIQKNDFSPNQWYHSAVSFPLRESKFFKNYKNFFVEKINTNEINEIIIVGQYLENILYDTFNKDCFDKKKIGIFTYSFKIIPSCKDFL